MILHDNCLQFATKDEIAQAARASVIIIPIGAVEQHGDHLAVGFDYLLSHTLACRVAARLAGSPPIIVAPPLPFGYSEHHLPFGGTLSLRAETLLSVLVDLGRSASIAGFKHLFFLNGHGGNVDISALAARKISLHSDMKVGAGSYWTMAAPAIADLGAGALGQVPGHAGGFETSLALAMDPTLVRTPLLRRDSDDASTKRLPKQAFSAFSHDDWTRIDGRTDCASHADAAFGAELLEAITVSLSTQLREFSAPTNANPIVVGRATEAHNGIGDDVPSDGGGR